VALEQTFIFCVSQNILHCLGMVSDTRNRQTRGVYQFQYLVPLSYWFLFSRASTTNRAIRQRQHIRVSGHYPVCISSNSYLDTLFFLLGYWVFFRSLSRNQKALFRFGYFGYFTNQKQKVDCNGSIADGRRLRLIGLLTLLPPIPKKIFLYIYC